MTGEGERHMAVCLEACLAKDLSVDTLRWLCGDRLPTMLEPYVRVMPISYGRSYTKALAIDARWIGEVARRILWHDYKYEARVDEHGRIIELVLPDREAE